MQYTLRTLDRIPAARTHKVTVSIGLRLAAVARMHNKLNQRCDPKSRDHNFIWFHHVHIIPCYACCSQLRSWSLFLSTSSAMAQLSTHQMHANTAERPHELCPCSRDKLLSTSRLNVNMICNSLSRCSRSLIRRKVNCCFWYNINRAKLWLDIRTVQASLLHFMLS